MNQFKNLYECKFQLTEREILLREIAEQYVRDADAYDRTVCTGPIKHGEIMPYGYQELALVNRNARRLMDLLCQSHPQFSRSEIRRAISAADR
ncbi:hypothetical protein [Pseudomonas sp. VB3]|uniref:hypothetical protein n=1 Tax=Pseudomonas sp. VB3 TaxID=2994641 RepID=UPI0022EC9429|nr:hypothetical protein [Pseudomonas sp. VB3]